MRQTEYKFERFIQPDFPIYASVQSGRRELVLNHHHSSAELMQVLEGSVQLLVGTVYTECQKGDIVFLPPSVAHEVVSLSDDASIRGIVFEFSIIDIAGLKLDFYELFRRSQGLHYMLTPDHSSHSTIQDYMNCIFEIYGNFSVGSKIQLISTLLLIMSELIQSFQLEISVHDKNYRKLRQVLDYVDLHFAEKIQISELSEIIHVCDDRLIRLFKEVTGETPIEYIMNLRMEAAIKLLSATELSVAEIADQTGFGSATYMTRVFKQKLNTTPGKYRH